MPSRSSGPSPRGWGEHVDGAAAGVQERTIPTRVRRTGKSDGPRRRLSDHPHAGGENFAGKLSADVSSGPSPRGWGERQQIAHDHQGPRTIPTRVGRTRITVGFVSLSSGPSPRGWGERRGVLGQRRLARTIPTRVGRTRTAARSSSGRADHPHAGGENTWAPRTDAIFDGPSPRGWGEPIPSAAGFVHWRTIPTRVGRTASIGRPRINSADHPHAGGENRGNSRPRSSSNGPSPRGWGERWRGDWRSGFERTIPTRVGRTCGSHRESKHDADHPHAGGENRGSSAPRTRTDGPSPRGWGERTWRRGRCWRSRTIPTRVGRTRTGVRSPTSASDHPHAGGENWFCIWTRCRNIGPSPRGWGELEDPELGLHDRRTIPTRVGRTCRRRAVVRHSPDHPHAGGENPRASSWPFLSRGPSPRGWGELQVHPAAAAVERTIPTRVGRTVAFVPSSLPSTDHPHAGGENVESRVLDRAEIGPSPRGWGEHA